MAIFVDVGVMKLGLIVVICYLGTGNQFVIIVSGVSSESYFRFEVLRT